MDTVAFHEKTEHIIRVTFGGREGGDISSLECNTERKCSTWCLLT